MAMKLRKWPIANRLIFAFGLLVLIQVTSGFVTLFQFSRINKDISQLVNVGEPLEESVLEMEINAGEIARAVIDYVRDQDQKHQAQLVVSRDRFIENHKQFKQLASSNDAQNLSNIIITKYSEYSQIATSIIRLTDQRDAALKTFESQVKNLNQLIDTERLNSVDNASEVGTKVADAMYHLEKHLNFTLGSIEEYIVKRSPNLSSHLLEVEQNFKLFENQYLQTISDLEKKQSINEIKTEFSIATSNGDRVIKLTNELDQLLQIFEQRLDQIDDLLHDQVRPLVYSNSVKATHDADTSIQSAKTVINVLAITGTIFGVFIVWIISQGIVAPITELSEGAELIAEGHVEHRIPVKSQDEIGRLAEAFNHMVEDLVIAHKEAEQASNIKSAFLANMSHEIRTPMTAILGFAEIMRQRNNDPETIRQLDTITKNGEYLLELINDILDVSKIEADKLEVEEIECSLVELIEDVKTLMELRALDKGLNLKIKIDGKIPRFIQSDPIRLRQILINLLSNAIKFTKHGSVQLVIRTVEIDSQTSRLEFDVIDTGIGMTEEQISRLFQPFAQADSSTTRKYGGTGLGLTICKRLTNMMGGEIKVSSEYGAGTTFTVTMKIGKVSNQEFIEHDFLELEALHQSDNTNAKSDEVKLNYNILLAEDGHDNQKLIRFLLEKEGAKVTLAENGKIAVQLALEAIEKDNPFDVILMDMQMPELDGYAATKLLRSKGFSYPIIALTAHTMGGAREECIAAGCNNYATKPIKRDLFFKAIQKSVCEFRQNKKVTS